MSESKIDGPDIAVMLAEAYGRPVPANVILTENFDGPDGMQSKPGDSVVVVFPPDGTEVDECSLFVTVCQADGLPGVERVYEHEFQA